MICPNGCTDDNDAPIEMEFGFTGGSTTENQPAYICPDCGYSELQRDRGRL